MSQRPRITGLDDCDVLESLELAGKHSISIYNALQVKRILTWHIINTHHIQKATKNKARSITSLTSSNLEQFRDTY